VKLVSKQRLIPPKGTPPMKNGNQKSVSETVCIIDNPEIASENSASREGRGMLSWILGEGAQKM